MKTCKTCRLELSLDRFSKAAENRDRLCHDCKACASVKRKAHYAANREHERATNVAYTAANRAKVLAKKAEAQRAWNAANAAIKGAQDAAYATAKRQARDARFLATCNKSSAARRARELQAAAGWADQALMLDIYELASIYRAAGVDCHVDHIYPLAGREVCGLHTDANLTVLLAKDNRRKSNRMPEAVCL